MAQMTDKRPVLSVTAGDRQALLAPGTVGALTLVACLALSWRPALWADERFTLHAAALPWSDLASQMRSVDAALSPYYAFMHLWTSIGGDSAFWVRLPSALAMGAAAVGVVILGRRLYGQWAGILGGLVFAVVPFVSRYGQEARPYAFAVCFAVWSGVALLRAIHRGGRWWWVYGSLVAGLGFSHLLGLCVLAAHGVRARQSLARWSLWSAVGVLPVLPLAWMGLGQRAALAWVEAPDLQTIRLFPNQLTGLGLTAVGLLLGVLVARWPQWSLDVVWLVVWILVTPVVLFIASYALSPMYLDRYLLVGLPALAVLLGAALARLDRRLAIVLVLVVALSEIASQRAMRGPEGHGPAAAFAEPNVSLQSTHP